MGLESNSNLLHGFSISLLCKVGEAFFLKGKKKQNQLVLQLGNGEGTEEVCLKKVNSLLF